MQRESKSIVEYLDDEPTSIMEYWEIFKRRQLLFWLPAVAIALVAGYLALTLPPIYRSQATILIEDQALQQDLIGATTSSYAARQIDLITQRLLTSKNVREIAEKFEVYGPIDPANPPSPTGLASQFRNDVLIELVTSEAAVGKGAEPTVAFTLAFKSSDPEIAQKVTDELTTLFLGENVRSSASSSSGVSELLRTAVDNANVELLKMQAELADFKASHEGALPELHELNLGVVNRTELQLSDVNSRIQQLQQRNIELSAQRAQLSPSAPVTLPTGETIMSDRDRLRALLIDYRRKSAIYTQEHPDIGRLEREIESLRSTVSDADSYPILQEQIRLERDRLTALKERYTADHPDIKNSEATITAMEAALATLDPSAVEAVIPDNPAYVMINTQLQFNELELAALIQKKSELEAVIAEHEALIRQAPQVEMEYAAVLRRYNNAKAKYDELQGRLQDAEISADIGQELSGQRFTLIEPAALPLWPTSPNRTSIMLLGFILGAGAGLGCIVLAEILDNSIRTVKKLADVAGAPPLAVIPYLNNSADVVQARHRHVLISGAVAVSILCVAYAFYNI